MAMLNNQMVTVGAYIPAPWSDGASGELYLTPPYLVHELHPLFFPMERDIPYRDTPRTFLFMLSPKNSMSFQMIPFHSRKKYSFQISFFHNLWLF